MNSFFTRSLFVASAKRWKRSGFVKMFKQHIIVPVAIQAMYQKINLELDLFLAILTVKVKCRLLSQNCSYVNLKLQR